MYYPKKKIFCPWALTTKDNSSLAEEFKKEAEKQELWCVIDGQHSLWNWQSIEEFCKLSYPLKPMVRIPEISPFSILQALQCGARGLMIPQVMTEEQAKLVVKYAYFSPLGERSKGGLRFDNRYGEMPNEQYFKEAKSIFIICQIEHINALSNIEKIMAINGIDGLFIGVEDLTISDNSYGKNNETGLTWDQPVIWETADTLEKTSKKYKKVWGMPITKELYKKHGLTEMENARFFAMNVNEQGLKESLQINQY